MGDGLRGWGGRRQEPALTSLCVPGEHDRSVRGSKPEHQPIFKTCCGPAGPHTSAEKPWLREPPPFPSRAGRSRALSLGCIGSLCFLPENRKSRLNEVAVFLCALTTHPHCVETSTDSNKLYSCTILISSYCRIWSQRSNFFYK